MKKKLVSCILVVCMLLTMLPTMAWAEPVATDSNLTPVATPSDVPLNITNGSIEITDAGWTQGSDSGSELNVTISGTATTANTITVNGGNPTITFSGLNIKRDNDNSSSVPVLTVNSDATIKLDGTNTIDSTAATTNNANTRTNIITIADNATLTVETVDGSGSLDITAGLIHVNNGTSPVKGEGTFKMVSGTVYVSSSGTIPALGCAAAELLGGSLTLNATGHSTAKALVVENLTISGGELDVTGRAGGIEVTNFTMSGGIIEKITVTSGNPAFSATNVSITGGNVNGYYTGDVNGRTLTKLQVNGDNYLPLANEEITLYENGTDELKATTNSSGLIYTYLANDTTTLKYKDVTYNVTPGTDVVLGAQFSEQTFNIAVGAITAEAGTNGKTKYTQGTTVYEAAADEKVYIIGSGTTSNYLEVNSGTANVILYNVNINNPDGSQDDADGTIRVKGGTLNLTLQGENVFTKNMGGLISVGSTTDPTNKNAAILNITCAEGADCSNENCPHSLTLNVTRVSRSAIIGTARFQESDGVSKATAGTVNIAGGHIIIPNSGEGAGIGTANFAYGGDNVPVNVAFAINISGGYIDITMSDKAYTVAIGMGRYSGSESDVGVNITGGKIEIDGSKASSIDTVGIGTSRYSDGAIAISVGSETATDNKEPIVDVKLANGTAIGKSASNWGDMAVTIESGKISAEGTVAIGSSMAGGYGANTGDNIIKITGGEVAATGSAVGIGAVGPSATSREMETIIEISGDAKVEATGTAVAIGMTAMGTASSADIKISSTAAVTATATAADGVAIGTVAGEAAPAENSTSISIAPTSDVTVSAAQPIAAATETKLAEGTTYTTVIGETEVITTLPDGGSVANNGGVATEGTMITEDANTGVVTITDKDGKETTIAPPADGGSITVKPDGTVEVPAGSTVTKDGETTTLTQGGTVDKDGTVTDPTVTPENPDTPPAGGGDDPTPPAGDGDDPVTPPADDEGDKPTPQPPYIGGYYPSYTPSVTPAAPSVDSSSLNNAALAVGSAIKDGSAEFTPVNGYTKDEVLQLQKDGKLRMGIEKKSGYGSVADKNLAEAAIKSAGGAVNGVDVMYFDITPVLKLDNGTVVAHVTDTEKAITITIELSDELTKAAKDGKDIAVVRVHDGKAEIISAKLNAAKTKVTFSSADFSTYAVVALNKATSAKTFDAGVAMYVGMAVLAATGSAVVVGKKRK